MNNIIRCQEINVIISSYLSNVNIVMWRSTCRYNYGQKYTLQECVDKYVPDIYKYYEVLSIIAQKQYKAVDLRKFTSLQYLHCGNNIRFTDTGLLKLPNLKSLNCNFNTKITSKGIVSLTKLEILYMGNNAKIKYGINQLSSLTALYCNDSIENNDINKLINLQLLEVNKCSITDDVFKNFKKLKTFLCTSAPLLSDECFKYMPNLLELNCGFTTFFSITGMKPLRLLSKLTISNNTEINNESFQYLSNLIYLNCGYNNNVSDEALLYLSNLKYLVSISCAFTDVGISNLFNIEVLECGYNFNITKNSFINLSNLRRLHIGNNRNINNTTLKLLPKLTHLHCGMNTTITDYGISKLRDLICLDIGNNKKITHDSIKILNKLEILDCRRNTRINTNELKIKNIEYTNIRYQLTI